MADGRAYAQCSVPPLIPVITSVRRGSKACTYGEAMGGMIWIKKKTIADCTKETLWSLF